jgi:hypothetical protein
MEIATPSDVDLLNSALKSLNELSVAIRLVSENLASLQRNAMQLRLEFDRSGSFKSASYMLDKTKTPISDDQLICVRSDCEWLPKYVDSLWQAWREADAAIGSLSRPLVEKLDALTKSPWVATVRRNCLDLILKWPGDRRHQTSYGAEKVAGTVSELLKKANNSNPHETWDAFEQQLSDYSHDLFAIRDVLAPPQQSMRHVTSTLDQGVRANTSKLFPHGEINDRDVVELVLKINTELNDEKSLNQIAREYTGETKGKDSRAQSLLTKIRRLKRVGRVNY